MTILETIVAAKREEAADLRRRRTPSSFASDPLYEAPTRSLMAAIRAARRPAVIAEIKKASPSAGVLNASALAQDVARGYRLAGASAISVLTDERFFGGRVADLVGVRRAVDIPLLRKDFIIDEIQLFESKSIGADAVLLIAAILDPGLLADLRCRAAELGLECLLEVHHPSELDRFDLGSAAIVGINNRNLHDFTIDLRTTGRIAALLPPGVARVSESGLRSAADVRTVAACNVDAVLMGEYFMSGSDPADRLRRLLDELGKN